MNLHFIKKYINNLCPHVSIRRDASPIVHLHSSQDETLNQNSILQNWILQAYSFLDFLYNCRLSQK